jgi:hypothetical protein
MNLTSPIFERFRQYDQLDLRQELPSHQSHLVLSVLFKLECATIFLLFFGESTVGGFCLAAACAIINQQTEMVYEDAMTLRRRLVVLLISLLAITGLFTAAHLPWLDFMDGGGIGHILRVSVFIKAIAYVSVFLGIGRVVALVADRFLNWFEWHKFNRSIWT